MKGYNEDEVLALTDFALARHVDIAFIEEMPLGEASDHAREDTTCSNAWVRAQIEKKYQLIDSPARTAGPSRYSQVAGYHSRIGFISPVTHNFVKIVIVFASPLRAGCCCVWVTSIQLICEPYCGMGERHG